ncbi:peptide chain release factor N(5)-glutamine methyltransferase [Alkalibacillus silvisoli]
MANHTVREARNWAFSFLKQHHREQRVGDLLLRHLLEVNHSQFLAMQRDLIAPELFELFVTWVEEHAEAGKPVEHFTCEVEFFDRQFYVDDQVLIPRPETEELIMSVLNEIDQPYTVVDLGTGSGVIAITLKIEWPKARIFATDLSEEALSVARYNSEKLEADVEFMQGDFLTPITAQKIIPDVIVSNPPYIPYSEREHLSETVKLHDPKQALFAEQNGLAAYETIIKQVMQLAKKPRLTAFEIGYDQGEAVPSLIKQYDSSAQVKVIQDINRKDRIVLWK